LCSSSIEVM